MSVVSEDKPVCGKILEQMYQGLGGMWRAGLSWTLSCPVVFDMLFRTDKASELTPYHSDRIMYQDCNLHHTVIQGSNRVNVILTMIRQLSQSSVTATAIV